ncbi:pyridoxamine 5'-phosphate oxidase family protein [Kitasatospora sp. NBC_00240]|uniref:pyridoxamine 5'-phosphate oxidase family protein n=1 Tax=Kitasatospora sp. NBC_00240 TaxID=2903567 RepID=UPI00225358A7|nr:pyridoxamine 5'-phosphate oxidase family protein [Kitasatospora sp. NBC_00240]MCX5208296.1 pyridoxamine 5'-phosphate oxidase family protein [Kitasatospora sp. NBC_00240]
MGDRVIVEGARPGVPRRDGKVIAVHRPDSEPPWEVLWSDTGHSTLFFPGPDSRLHHFTRQDPSGQAPRPSDRPHTSSETERSEPAGPGEPTGGPEQAMPGNAGDLGRRVALRREQLGLGREQAAVRAGMAVPYLDYLDTSPTDVESGALARLAAVLGTSVTQLLGGELDLPPDRASTAAHPVLEELARSECWERLSTDGVGRVALGAARRPIVLPANYWVLDGTLIFRTAADGPLAATVSRRVAFEVDRIDEVLRTGWSVLATGDARPTTWWPPSVTGTVGPRWPPRPSGPARPAVAAARGGPGPGRPRSSPISGTGGASGFRSERCQSERHRQLTARARRPHRRLTGGLLEVTAQDRQPHPLIGAYSGFDHRGHPLHPSLPRDPPQRPADDAGPSTRPRRSSPSRVGR